MSTATAPVSAAQQPALLTYSHALTDMAARVISRTPGNDYYGPPKAFVQVSGRCAGSPFESRVTIIDGETLLAGCAQDVADDAAWHLQPFLGELSAAQVAAIVEAVTDAAKGVA